MAEKKTAKKATAAKKVTAAQPAAKKPATAAKKPAAVKEPAAQDKSLASSALTGLMSSMLSNSSINSVSGKADVDAGSVAGILATALPSLLNGANGQASSAETTEDFYEAVNSHAAKDPDSVDVNEGAKIISHLLGSNEKAVTNEIAKKTGMSSKSVALVLAAAAPILMNLLGQQTSNQHSSSGVASLLGSMLGGGMNSSSSNSLMSSALSSVLSGALGGGSSSNSLLGSLLGGGSSCGGSSMASSLLGSLLGGSSNSHQSSGLDLGGILSSLLK